MPRSALPEHINEAHEWDGKDDDQHWYTKWRKSVKHLMAFGPRAKESWARWREVPKILFCAKGRGPWRWEYFDGSDTGPMITGKHYVTRCQLWTRWHIALQWPLFFSCHFYPKASDVIPAGQREDRDGKLWLFYIGAKRDADRVYWFPAFYIGRNWK